MARATGSVTQQQPLFIKKVLIPAKHENAWKDTFTFSQRKKSFFFIRRFFIY